MEDKTFSVEWVDINRLLEEAKKDKFPNETKPKKKHEKEKRFS